MPAGTSSVLCRYPPFSLCSYRPGTPGPPSPARSAPTSRAARSGRHRQCRKMAGAGGPHRTDPGGAAPAAAPPGSLRPGAGRRRACGADLGGTDGGEPGAPVCRAGPPRRAPAAAGPRGGAGRAAGARAGRAGRQPADEVDHLRAVFGGQILRQVGGDQREVQAVADDVRALRMCDPPPPLTRVLPQHRPGQLVAVPRSRAASGVRRPSRPGTEQPPALGRGGAAGRPYGLPRRGTPVTDRPADHPPAGG